MAIEPRRLVLPTWSLRRALGGLLVVTIGAGIGYAAGNQPVLALAGAVFALIAILTAQRPELATLVMVALLYSNAMVVLVRFQDVPAILPAAVPAILFVPIVHSLLVRREGVVVDPALPWIVGYFLVQLVSTIFARDTADTTAGLTTFITEGLVLFFLVTNAVRTPQILRGVIWALLIVGGLLGALSVFQSVTGTYGNSYFGFAQTEAAITGTSAVGTIERLAGPIGEKNRYAQVMLMLVPLGIMQSLAERRRALKMGAIACAVLAAMATALTFSRGAALAGVGVLVVMALLRMVRVSQMIAALVIVVAVLLAVPEYGARVSSLGSLISVLTTEEGIAGANADNSLASRSTENIAALNVLLDHPLIGVGPGEFSSYYREYANEIGLSVRAQDREAHNLYLGVAAEAGLPGLICFLGAVVVTLRRLMRARRDALAVRPQLAVMATGVMLALVAYLFSGIFLHLSFARYFWLMLALGGAAAAITLRAVAEARSSSVAESRVASLAPAEAFLRP